MKAIKPLNLNTNVHNLRAQRDMRRRTLEQFKGELAALDEEIARRDPDQLRNAQFAGAVLTERDTGNWTEHKVRKARRYPPWCTTAEGQAAYRKQLARLDTVLGKG